MKEVFVVAAVRTPIGKFGGALRSIRPDDLAALVLRKAVEKSGVNPDEIEDVIMGAANQAGEDNRDVARMAVLLADLPIKIGGVTVNRLCASGLQAIMDAYRACALGEGQAYIAGGVESMTRAPFVMSKAETAFSRSVEIYDTSIGWRFVNPELAKRYHPYSMGETAENVAQKYNITREQQDEFAYHSQQKYANAASQNRFDDEIIPVSIPQSNGEVVIFSKDENPRPDTTLEKLAKLKPAFRKDGTVTAGNSSSLNDGAAALVLVSEEILKRYNLNPLARIISVAVAGVHPDIMGIGPVPATQKALKRAGLSVEDLDLIELNEAFASQSIACIRDLNLDLDKVNVNGGAIAIGHPLGCSGARISTTLIHELRKRRKRYGLATMCVGVGQGAAIIYEAL
ncbi:MAG: acetyl-CoA C-acyltransferase [Bacteroidia bacterium]|nr:acetyl-CoA C-acyltransferase [Bacteroidia bacterium]MDW8346391.1 acetyl-CoA C-acyltransferase [Bacteroidia bacterium]